MPLLASICIISATHICNPPLRKCLKYSASATHPLLRKVSNIPNFLGTLCVPASAHCLVRKRSVKSWSSNPDSRSIHLRTHDNDEDDGAKDVGVGDATAHATATAYDN